MIHIGPFMINWHGVLTALGILVGWYISRRMARRFGIDPEEISRLAPYLVLAAVIGGRVAYVLSHLGEFAGNPWEIVRIDRGGLASHGALLFGVVTVFAYARRHALPTGRLLDALALAVPINYLAMRIGNFLIGELYGDPTSLPWGVVFPGTWEPRHPAQLYDGSGQIVVLMVLILLARLAKRRWPGGQLFWVMLIGTSVVRLFSDLFRTELRTLGPLTLGQVTAIFTIVVATGFLRWRARKGHRALEEDQAVVRLT